MSRVRTAILGCGGMAGNHARRFAKHPDVDIVALCDVAEDILSDFIEGNLKGYEPRPAFFTDAAQMYAETGLDAIVIVTPHTLHFEHAMQALGAGCHILMEKPMVTNSRQAHALAAKVEEAGKVFVIGYNSPCTPTLGYIRDAIRSGELGRLELVSGWLTQDWMKWASGTWRQRPELSGGGQMYDSGAHLFNTLVWTVEQPIEAVHAFVDCKSTPVDINGTVNVRFSNGVLATVMISGDCPSYRSEMVFVFTNGRIEVEGCNGSWIKVWKGTGETDVLLNSAMTNPSDNFIDAILGRAEACTSPINGIIQSELMDAIYESVLTGQVVKQ